MVTKGAEFELILSELRGWRFKRMEKAIDEESLIVSKDNAVHILVV